MCRCLGVGAAAHQALVHLVCRGSPSQPHTSSPTSSRWDGDTRTSVSLLPWTHDPEIKLMHSQPENTSLMQTGHLCQLVMEEEAPTQHSVLANALLPSADESIKTLLSHRWANCQRKLNFVPQPGGSSHAGASFPFNHPLSASGAPAIPDCDSLSFKPKANGSFVIQQPPEQTAFSFPARRHWSTKIIFLLLKLYKLGFL